MRTKQPARQAAAAAAAAAAATAAATSVSSTSSSAAKRARAENQLAQMTKTKLVDMLIELDDLKTKFVTLKAICIDVQGKNKALKEKYNEARLKYKQLDADYEDLDADYEAVCRTNRCLRRRLVRG